MSELPLIDEHTTRMRAPILAAWQGLVATLERSRRAPTRELGARLLGCREIRANSLSLREIGATTPGFRVVTAIPLSWLALAGEHRFSRYSLDFKLRLISVEDTEIAASTRAQFPGMRGRVYRELVIGSGMHVLAVRSLLRAVKSRAEQLDARPRVLAA